MAIRTVDSELLNSTCNFSTTFVKALKGRITHVCNYVVLQIMSKVLDITKTTAMFRLLGCYYSSPQLS